MANPVGFFLNLALPLLYLEISTNERMIMEKDGFFPKGAIAFFASMILFYLLFWLAMYGFMVSQQ